MTRCTGDTVTEVSRGEAGYAAYNKLLNELREADEREGNFVSQGEHHQVVTSFVHIAT